MVCAPPLIGNVAGHTLVMAGFVLLTVRLTVMLCALAPAPDAVTVIFPTYAAAWGARLDASTEIVRTSRSPGSTTPTVGVTCSQAAPEAAENEMGVPFVDSVTVCAAGGIGGAVKLSVVELKVTVDGGEVTANVTGMFRGFVMPVTVTVTVALYVPTARLVGLARKLRVPGSLPVSGLTVNHSVFVPAIAVVNAGVPAFVFTETTCAAGSAAPIGYVKFAFAGVAVTVTVCAWILKAVAQQSSNIFLTPCLSAWGI